MGTDTRYYIQTRFNGYTKWYNIGIGYNESRDALAEFNRLKDKFRDEDFRLVEQKTQISILFTTEAEDSK